MSITETQGVATDASSLFLGDWSQMMLGWRTQMTVEVARELYRGNYQFGYFGHLRFDMQVTHPESFGRLIGILPDAMAFGREARESRESREAREPRKAR